MAKLHVSVRNPASLTTKVIVVMPTGKLLPLTRPAICVVLAPLQLSVPTGATKFTTLPQPPGALFTVMEAGQVMLGASLSLTFTVKLQVAVLP